MPKLGVNIDHIATLRQARGGKDPDPVEGARLCERSGAHSIVAHLREDRRHINDHDIKRLRKTVRTRLNLEMSIDPKIVRIACGVRPDQATLVPEKRKELTTEGGLDVMKYFSRIKKTVAQLHKRKIVVSLFIDPEENQIRRARETGAEAIEIHTGAYANASTKSKARRELQKIRAAVKFGNALGFVVHAGHGLNYHNTRAIAAIRGISELNIGHAIISRSVLSGLEKAVREMVAIARQP